MIFNRISCSNAVKLGQPAHVPCVSISNIVSIIFSIFRHTLATQKHTFDHLSGTRAPTMATAPTPPARERIPMSFHSSQARTRASSPLSSGSSVVSTIASAFPSSSGGYSPPNVALRRNSRRQFRTAADNYGSGDTAIPDAGSMRRQLLQRLWSREFQRFNRTGSESPPLQRSQRNRRAWRFIETPSPTACLECQKLDAVHFNRSVPEITSKRAKYSKLSSTFSSFTQKSHSIETETIEQPESVVDVEESRPSESVSTVDPNDSREVDENRNFTSSEVDDSDVNMAPSNSTFQIEMDGDQINIITTTTTTNTTSSSDSIAAESRPTNHVPMTFRSNENDSIKRMVRSDKNSNYESDVGADSANDNENGECVTQVTPSSTTTTISIDQSTIDSFISQILVDSLNNIIVVEGIVSGPSSNDDNNLSGVMHSVSSQTETDTSTSTVDDNYYVEENAAPTDALTSPQNIYFPKYATDESLSEFSAKYSNDSMVTELPVANIVISVISGSSYPLDGGELIVHRYAQIPRTESMEVRPSSGSVIDGDGNDENGDDDNISLVDSLDDPTENHRHIDGETNSPKLIEKSKAFFVPMDNDKDQDASAEQETPDVNVGYAMPERLRERLQQRQMEMSRRKEYEMKRKQEKIQRIIEQFENKGAAAYESSEHSDVLQVGADMPDTKTVPVRNRSSTDAQLSNVNTHRRSIGLLESYTIDAQGNLLFKEPQKAKAANGKKGPLTMKRGSSKLTPKPTALIARKPREIVSTKVVAVKRTNANAAKPLSNSRLRNTKNSIIGRRADVQKMTLYHHSPTDMVTPDADCGPRRLYQKTEIHDGKKRIEILEIVECANSSPDSLATTATTTSPTSSTTTAQTKSSKIPVPVPPVKKSVARNANGNHQRLSKASSREMPSNYSVSKSFAKNFHQLNNNSKVDQIIADLLIEALNSSTDIGIEFVQTPQQGAANAACTNQSSLIKVSNTKRVCLASAATGTSNGRRNSVSGGGKRSAHSSGKYHQVFDAIPEEKSSLSVDSPENKAEFIESELNSSRISDAVSSSIDFVQENSVDSTDGPANASGSMNGQARGKEAVHSDQEKPEAWFGCFGQRHNESPVDPLLLDEGIFKDIHKSSVLV